LACIPSGPRFALIFSKISADMLLFFCKVKGI
jgi:hypothetical protein